MKKLMNNKKGAIFNLFSGLGDIIKSFFDLLPKPIKFLFFLILLLILGAVIGWLLNGFGVYCDSADNPVRISNVFSSIDLMNEIPDTDLLNLEVIEPQETESYLRSSHCNLCYEAGEVIVIRELRNGSKIEQNISQRTCFYKDSGCVICEDVVELNPIDYNIFGNLRGYCMGKATIKPYEDKNLFQKALCGAKFYGLCQPPEHYFYDGVTEQYLCEDETCTGITAGDRWDDKLRKAGAIMLYPKLTTEELARNPDKTPVTKIDSDKLVQVSCQYLQPTITIYGIPIFDYRYWLIIMIIIILIGFYIKYKKA